jgi:hypothetical protein
MQPVQWKLMEPEKARAFSHFFGTENLKGKMKKDSPLPLRQPPAGGRAPAATDVDAQFYGNT